MTLRVTSQGPYNSIALPRKANTPISNTHRQAIYLAEMGYDITSVQPDPGFSLDPDLQEKVTQSVDTMEKLYPDTGLRATLFDPTYHMVGATWLRLSKRAVALNILYDPSQETLGGKISHEAFDIPLFLGSSAREIIIREKAKRAESIFNNYNQLIDTTLDDPRDKTDIYGLKSHPYLAGVPDSIAVRLRAATAIDEIVHYATEKCTPSTRLKIVSLACGAAGPIFKLIPVLEKNNIQIDVIRLIDWDVMALASASSMAKNKGFAAKTEIQRRDLLRSNPKDYISDADVVDILGLFEYFPTRVDKHGFHYNLAQNYINEVGRAMKPGSMIVVGNMLKDRPHQTMFNQVWPHLEQRSVGEMVALFEAAGFPQESISVRLPYDGVYAVYTLRIPEGGIEAPQISAYQKLARRVLLGSVKEY